MMRPTALPLFFATVGLTACRVLPHDGPPSPAIDVPERWNGADADAADPLAGDELWWHGFGDASLAHAVDEALANNPDLRISVARLGGALAQARVDSADLYPSLSANGNASRQQQVFVGLPIPADPTDPNAGNVDVLQNRFNNYGASLDVSWELDLWGRIRAIADAAEADVRVAAEDLRAARHSLAAQTAKAWLAWQEAQLQVELADRSVTSFADTRDLVQRRFDGGLASAFDVRRAEADVAAAMARAEQRRDTVERAVRQLELLLGRVPSGSFAASPVLPEMPPSPPFGVPGEIIARRPDLAAAEARLQAADDRLYAARANLYPRLTLTGSAGRNSDEPGDLTDPDFSVWSIAAGLTQPIFQGGRLRAGVDLADSGVRQALASFEASLLRALGEVEIALVGEVRLGRLLDAQGLALEQASAARELAQERYTAGLSDLLDVLVSQRQELDAESSLLSVRRLRLDQRVDLHLALGGGFEVPSEPEHELAEELPQPDEVDA